MGKSVSISVEELFETANRLEAEGKEVTALGLLNALGRGSLTTIYKHLEAWKTAKPVKAHSSANEMPDMVKSAFAVAWREASQEAAREVEAVKARASEETNAALKQFHGALEAIAILEKQRDNDQDVIEGLQAQAAESKLELAKAETEVAAEKARADELKEQLRALQGERDTAIKAASELKGKAETLATQNEKLLAKLSQSEPKKSKS